MHTTIPHLRYKYGCLLALQKKRESSQVIRSKHRLGQLKRCWSLQPTRATDISGIFSDGRTGLQASMRFRSHVGGTRSWQHLCYCLAVCIIECSYDLREDRTNVEAIWFAGLELSSERPSSALSWHYTWQVSLCGHTFWEFNWWSTEHTEQYLYCVCCWSDMLCR